MTSDLKTLMDDGGYLAFAEESHREELEEFYEGYEEWSGEVEAEMNGKLAQAG